MPDAQTAVNALQSGDIDFLEITPFDLVPALSANKELKVETLNKLGYHSIARMNFLYPPFDNVKVRRAAFMAVNQKDFMDALVGNDEYYIKCGSIFICGSPLESADGSDPIVKGNGMAEAKKLLAESGYDGTPVLLMAPTDVVTLKTQPIVMAQQLRQAGFTVNVQALDWQTVVSRRANPEAAEGRRLEHVHHQRDLRRPDQPDRQSAGQLQGHQGARGSAGPRTRRSRSCAMPMRAPPPPTSRRKSPPRSSLRPTTR